MKKHKEHIQQKDIIFLNHIGDDGNETFHPFLILYRSQQRILGLQFTSFHNDGSTHFGHLPPNSKYVKVIQSYSNRDTDLVALDDKRYLEHKSITNVDILYDFYLDEIPDEVKFSAIVSDEIFDNIVSFIDFNEDSWEKEIYDLLVNIKKLKGN